MLGGTAATIAAASPAAAATGSFDTTTYAPALTAASSGSGLAISASSTGAGNAVEVTGPTELTAVGNTLTSIATGPNAVGVWAHADNAGAILKGTRRGAWLIGDIGVQASGESAQFIF